jgi:ferredoxin--NADP+ reductase
MVAAHSHVVSRVTLSFSEELSNGIFIFGFPRKFEFRSGQVIGISLHPEGARRLYSICSGEQDPEIWILYHVVDEGFLTPRLSSLEKGDTIWITEPRGSFTGSRAPAVWIAAGTGIAPFYSMFRSGLHTDKTLIHGSRYLEQFFFYDEFSDALGPQYIRCCTSEYDDHVYHGRVTSYLNEVESLDTNMKYYLCGSAEMVVDTRDILIERGVSFNHIISEIYF